MKGENKSHTPKTECDRCKYEKRKQEIKLKNGEVFKNCKEGEITPVKAVVHKEGLIELVPLNLSK